MATVSEVKKALVDIATTIANERRALALAKARMSTAVSNLQAIPTVFSEIIAEINAYAPTGAFETLAKNEKDLMTVEYQALRTAAEGAVSTLSTITEF